MKRFSLSRCSGHFFYLFVFFFKFNFRESLDLIVYHIQLRKEAVQLWTVRKRWLDLSYLCKVQAQKLSSNWQCVGTERSIRKRWSRCGLLPRKVNSLHESLSDVRQTLWIVVKGKFSCSPRYIASSLLTFSNQLHKVRVKEKLFLFLKKKKNFIQQLFPIGRPLGIDQLSGWQFTAVKISYCLCPLCGASKLAPRGIAQCI